MKKLLWLVGFCDGSVFFVVRYLVWLYLFGFLYWLWNDVELSCG